MRFVDTAELILKSGNGGRGASSFRREKYVPKGGPDGGDGGNGGSIILKADPTMGSLLDFKHKKMISAENGHPGSGVNKTGKTGEDRILHLPVGTLVVDVETNEIIADLTEKWQEIVLLKGGKGGLGNSHFTSSTNRTPTYCQPGLPGEEKRVRLELKLMADVGLLGFPNAGKSTLISRISAAKPKIADYPFTTLVPNLGVVKVGEDRTFVVADIPGIIEGASEGAGLGLRFLKHVERTRLLLHLVDIVGDVDPLERYRTIRSELVKFDPDLAARPEIIVLTKVDVTEAREKLPEVIKSFEDLKLQVITISSVTGEGIDNLVFETFKKLNEMNAGAE